MTENQALQARIRKILIHHKVTSVGDGVLEGDLMAAFLEPEELIRATPVMRDGTLENFMPTINGKPFRCECTCNVFHKPDDRDLNLFECNSCGSRYSSN